MVSVTLPMYINLIKNNMIQEETDHIGDTNKMVTAVEWFAKQLYDKMEMKGDGNIFDKLLEQAKEMEKEQIEDAYWEGGQDVPMSAKQCKQYYNETYGDK